METTSTLVLNHQQIQQKIRRIAHEIFENHFEEGRIFLIGIEDRGAVLSQRLFEELEQIEPGLCNAHTLKLNKESPLESPITCTVELNALKGQSVVLVDDVLNTGKALIYAAHHLLQAAPSQMHTAVLVDRKHRHFPIRADYVGLTLATTLQEHIAVKFDDQDAIYLV